MTPMKTVLVVGNPKVGSRTADAGARLAAALGGDPEVIEVADLGPGLLGWGDPAVASAVARVAAADLAIFASPTFKATYTGLLKLFLDQFAGATGLKGVVAVPLMLGAAPAHTLATELLLKPVLVELGATCPAQGLYQIDSAYAEDDSLSTWIAQWGETVRHAVEVKR